MEGSLCSIPLTRSWSKNRSPPGSAFLFPVCSECDRTALDRASSSLASGASATVSPMFRHGLQGEQPIVSEHLGSSIQQHYRQENVMTCHPMLSRDCPLAKLPMKRARSFTVVMP